MDGFFERVYEVVKQVPEGKVATYGDVARAIGAEVRSAGRLGVALQPLSGHSTLPQGGIPRRLAF